MDAADNEADEADIDNEDDDDYDDDGEEDSTFYQQMSALKHLQPAVVYNTDTKDLKENSKFFQQMKNLQRKVGNNGIPRHLSNHRQMQQHRHRQQQLRQQQAALQQHHHQSSVSSDPSQQNVRKLHRKIVCDCGRTFSYIGGYTYHLKWECGKVLSCHKCSKVFKDKSYLNKHMKMCFNYLV